MQWYAYPLHFPYQHPVPACRDKNKAGFHGRFLFSVQMFNRQAGKPWLRRHLSSPIHVLLWEPKHVAGDFGIFLVAATHERAKEHVCFNWQSHGGKAAMLAIDLCRTFIYMFAQLVLIVLAPEHVVIEWGMFVVHCCFAPFLWAICLPRPHQYPHSDSRLRECQQIPPSVVTMEQLWVIPEYPWWHDSVPNSGKPTSSKLPMGAMGAMVAPLMVWPTTVVDNA